jgi:hypothetical protein
MRWRPLGAEYVEVEDEISNHDHVGSNENIFPNRHMRGD